MILQNCIIHTIHLRFSTCFKILIPNENLTEYIRREDNLYSILFPRFFHPPPPLTRTTVVVHIQLVPGSTTIQTCTKKRYVSLDMCYLHPSIKFIDVFIRKNSRKLMKNHEIFYFLQSINMYQYIRTYQVDLKCVPR